MLDKARLLDALRARVSADLAAVERQQRDTQAASTHEESRAEHAKDMRATEQSYVARGLAERVEELQRTARALASAPLRAFGPDEPIAVGAIAVIASEGEARETWWVVAGAGGYALEQDGVQVRTVTPVSPLGRALLGLQADDEGTVRTPGGERRFAVLEVG